MKDKLITLEEIKEAYRKLKTHVYNDSFNLRLRIKLADFEYNKNIELLFEELRRDIINDNIDKYLSKISTYILPKKVPTKKLGNANIVRNDVCGLFNNIDLTEEDYNFYIDAPIEIYLIDVLWMMKEGFLLIDSQIKNDCYGNSLVFETDGDSYGIKRGHYLFERYFDKYQKWRDNGIKIAREQTQHKNDVLLVCLDIQRFYPTSQVDFCKIKEILQSKNSNLFLTAILERIYVRYQNVLDGDNGRKSKFPQLPIGLLSAGIIANWYLSDFDKEIKERFNPIYYGRYVDDIFMVLGNVKPNNNEDWFDEKFLYEEDSPLIPEKVIDNNNKEYKRYKLRSHSKLYINSQKLKLFYFAPNHSLAILDNFQKRLDENSSAFWFLPEDDTNETLNSRGFDIIYDDTINKFREISGIKNSKYGVSVFLTKQIKKEIICRDNANTNLKEDLFKYFTGNRLIDMYSLWEKVFTYFVVTNDTDAIRKFENSICKQIDLIKIKDCDTNTQLIRNSLQKHCTYCKYMAMALNYDMIDGIEHMDLPRKLRSTYLIRQHYTPFPVIIYTDSKINNIISSDIYNELLTSGNINLTINQVAPYINPRKIHTHEISLINLFNYIKNFSDTHSSFNSKKLIDELITYDLCSDINLSQCKGVKLDNNDKQEVDIPKTTCKSDESGNAKQQIKVALSNIKINNNDLISAIKGAPILNSAKRERHFHLINLSTEEKVDCLLLPEVSLPKELLVTYAEHSRRKQQLIIAGIEHIVSYNKCFNFSVVFLPYIHKGNKEVFILPRLKNHYSPDEIREILKYRKQVPTLSPSIYHLINWQGVQFTVFNCYELADVLHRSLFKSKIDIMFAIEYNKDTCYYSNIVEATCRDLHCYFIQANTSDYGDSRLSMPKRSVEMTPVKIKGGDNDTIITFTVDIKSLRDFQRQSTLFQNKEDFKNTPPGFDHDFVSQRDSK